MKLSQNLILVIFSLISGTDLHAQKQDFYLQDKKAYIYATSKGTEQRLTLISASEFDDPSQPNEMRPFIFVDPKKQFQEILGFGGALTDASAETFIKLPDEMQEELLTAYFDKEKGIGYTLARTHIHSCDFSSKSYAYSNDPSLDDFSVDEDQQYKIPFIKKAMKKSQELQLMASPWSPPAWMKTNNSMLQGGKLEKKHRQKWADYYVRFIEEYTKAGIPIWGVSVQNEPASTQTWESCLYTAEEERDFVRDYLGPTIEKSRFPDTKIVAWDHNRGIMYQRAKTVYDDPKASQYVWGTGFHWYVGDHFENVKLHYEAFPDKNLLFTEGCVFPFNMEKVNDWEWGERYGESILNDLNNGSVGWIDWNILLNEFGGPNHVANYCFAPIIGDTQSGKLIYMNSYYYLGHFSKFIRPGARRVIASSNYDDLQTTAFLNIDGSLIVVVLNLSDYNQVAELWIEGKTVTFNSPKHSILTLDIDN